MFGPAAEDLVRAVVPAAAGHARRGLINLKPGGTERGQLLNEGPDGYTALPPSLYW